MATRDDDPAIQDDRTTDVTSGFPTRYLPTPQVRDLPPEPRRFWRLIGPGIIAAGVGLASGEFILFPYIASQVGLVFVWAALVGLVTQFFLNMEIERYTLATGETALTGFSRYWRHWGLVFAVLTYFANLWPGWATSSATLMTYLFGGEPRWIAIGMLIVIGLILTLAPVVYVALERAQMLKVAAVLTAVRRRRHLRDRRRRRGRRPAGRDPAAHPRRRARLRPAARRAGLRRRRRRAEPGAVQLDPRQGLRHGHVRARGWSARSPASRRRRPSTGYVFEPTQREPAALARLVAVRQHRAAHHVRADHVRDDPVHLAARLLDRLRPRRPGQRHRLPPDRGRGARRARRLAGSSTCSG